MERYNEYKDSGVQWLGEIPGHWNCVRIKALFLNIREKNNPIQTEERLSLSIDKGVTLYSEKTTNLDRFKEDCSQYLLAHEDDIVLNSMNMIVGAVGKSKYFGCVSPAYYVIRLRDTSNNIDYYSQLLNIQKTRDVYRIMGKGIMAIDRGDGKVNTCRLKVPYDSFGSIKIPIPPLSEQHSIVSYLDDKCGKIDKMLEGKQKQIELLAEMKQRIIADAVTHGLNPDIKMKATNIPWLPEIPEHWEEKRMASMFTGDVETNKDFEYKHAFKFNYGQLVPKNEIGEAEDYREVYVKYSKIKQGDILVNGLNLNYDFISQRVACAPADGIITSAYVVCRPRKDVNHEYYTYLFKGMDSMKLFHGMGTGIRLTLSFKEMKKQILPIPPLSEQLAIVSYITDKTAKIDALTGKLQQEIESIKEYKQRLISDVVTGQIKVC